MDARTPERCRLVKCHVVLEFSRHISRKATVGIVDHETVHTSTSDRPWLATSVDGCVCGFVVDSSFCRSASRSSFVALLGHLAETPPASLQSGVYTTHTRREQEDSLAQAACASKKHWRCTSQPMWECFSNRMTNHAATSHTTTATAERDRTRRRPHTRCVNMEGERDQGTDSVDTLREQETTSARTANAATSLREKGHAERATDNARQPTGHGTRCPDGGRSTTAQRLDSRRRRTRKPTATWQIQQLSAPPMCDAALHGQSEPIQHEANTDFRTSMEGRAKPTAQREMFNPRHRHSRRTRSALDGTSYPQPAAQGSDSSTAREKGTASQRERERRGRLA